uniref:Uncharacterized protein n=1 Tax=Enterococcus phage Sw5 TaxID=2950724 RepID=A0A9E7MHR3_9CAUD|nr:hypothetical protein Sw5_153 [Enterococcus phage Sw5]
MKTTKLYIFHRKSELNWFLDNLEANNQKVVGFAIDPLTGARELIIETIKE